MGTKNNPGKFDCYENAMPDEPMFVILGRDKIGGSIVRMWAKNRLDDDPHKIQESLDCADAMDAWAIGLGKQPVALIDKPPLADPQRRRRRMSKPMSPP